MSADKTVQKIPWLIGGSADLAPSNKTRLTFEFERGPGSLPGEGTLYG